MTSYLFGLINLEGIKEQRELRVPEVATPMFKFNIKDYADNEEIEEVFFVSEYEIRTASNGKPFLDMVLGDGTKAKIFDENWKLKLSNLAKKSKDYFDNNSRVVLIQATVNEFPKGSGTKSLNIERFKKTEQEISPFLLLPTIEEDVVELVNEFYYQINKLEGSYLQVALKTLDRYWHEFSVKPAAKGHHHNYLGGLLKHTTKMLTIQDWVAEDPINRMKEIIARFTDAALQEMDDVLASETPVRPKDLIFPEAISHMFEILRWYIERSKEQKSLNKNVLRFATYKHDFGKQWEYANVGEDANKFALLYPHLDWSDLPIAQTGIAMDEQGKRVGHIPFAVRVLDQTLQELEFKFNGKDYIDIVHCIESHHGKPEWGSKKPETLEAILLHFVDYVDAKYEKYVQKNNQESNK